MPEFSKPALKLLQDLDFDAAKQINPEHLDFLIDKINKSTISDNRSPLLRTFRNPSERTPLGDILRKRGIPDLPETSVVPEFDVVQFSEVAQHVGLNKPFDFNQIFTVPDQKLGPFPLQDGTSTYYYFYKYIDDFKVFFPGENLAAFIIPVRLPRSIGLASQVSSLNLGKGNMWIRADLMDPAAPNTHYIGLKITGGSLALGGSYPLGSNSITIPKNSVLSIDINLDNSYAADTTENIGLDGKNSIFKPTDNIKLKTAGPKLILAELVNFSGKTLSWSGNLRSKYVSFFWDLEKKYMCLFLTTTDIDFDAGKNRSDLYNIRDKARIVRTLWMLPSRVLNQNQSVEVKFNGVLSLQLGKGLYVNWDGIKNDETVVLTNQCRIMFFNGSFHLESDRADFQYNRDSIALWQKSEENQSRMQVVVRFMEYKMLQIISQSSLSDAVTANADTEFFIDKPLHADNTPVAPKSKNSIYLKLALKDSKSVWILDTDMLTEDDEWVPPALFNIQHSPERFQFVLENAYFTTTKEVSLFLRAKYDGSNNCYEGNLLLTYGIFDFLPTLPHPYTTNIARQVRKNMIDGYLQATVEWFSVHDVTFPKVEFKMNHPFVGDEHRIVNLAPEFDRYYQDFLMTNRFMLFDVSTHSDHWGVGLSLQNLETMRKIFPDDVVIKSENVVNINRNYLQAPMGLLQGLTLPHVSWEPSQNITPPGTPGDPFTGILEHENNSIPTIFSQIDNQPVRIHPIDYMQTFRTNLKGGNGNQDQNLQSKVLFTLPNGKYSIASLNPYTFDTMATADHLGFIMPQFLTQNQKFRGGIQFRIASKKNQNPDAPLKMRGKTAQLPSVKDRQNIYVLGRTVTSIFNKTFYTVNEPKDVGVPITHIDFSGYGASTFSDWRNPRMKFASISQAKFNILKGRTAHEIVQAVSVIYPWGICVTRTVSFFRNNNAVIFREDSGWVAQSEGFFDFSFTWPGETSNTDYDSPYDIYPGMIQGLFKVRNIREDYNDVVKFDYHLQNGDFYVNESNNTLETNHSGFLTAEFVGVYFDADVQLDSVENKVTGRHFKGYLQISPTGIPIPARVLKEVLNKTQNPISGNIDVLLPIEKTLQKFKANAVQVKPSTEETTGKICFVGEVKGSVILPPDGSWSVVEVDKSSGTVQNLAAGTSVGLIKDGLRPKNNGNQYISNSNKTMLAFPDFLKNPATFKKTYGLLQNTDTQKLLLKSVEYVKGQTDKYTSDPALLADCWRLMNSKGPFPNINDAITIENGAKTLMNLLPEGAKKIFNMEVPNDFSFDILGKEGDSFRIYIKYTSIDKDGNPTSKSVIDYVTDTDSVEKWTNNMQNLTIAVDLAGFAPLMYITGDFGNGKKSSPSLESGSGPQLKLDKTLQTIYDILEFLSSLDPTQPSEAIKKGLKIAMSNSADSWEYKFKADKEIPFVKFPFDPVNYNSPTTPLKMDAFFKMGVYFNQPIKIPDTIDQIKPSVGTFLILGADLRVMCVSLAAVTLYAVGRTEVGLAADLNTPPTLHFKFGFGIELAVGLPVIGSVAVTYMVGIDMTINSVDLIVGAFLLYKGRVELFAGAVTVTIWIEAAGQVQKKLGPGKPTNLIARCTFALDITIAWVIDINFTETWDETRQIS